MREISGLPKDDIARFVSSYGEITWNHAAPDSPLLTIGLTDAASRREVNTAKIALLDAMFLPIGSTAQSGKATEQYHPISSTEISTTIEFDTPTYVNAFATIDGTSEYVIPRNKWGFPKSFGFSKFLDVTDNSGTRLLIPTLEIFLKTYGMSAFFKKTFLNESSTDALAKLTYNIDYSKLENRPLPHQVPIGLTRDTLNQDIPVIHALQSTEFLKNVHRNVRRQLNFSRGSKCFLRVPFWFQGTIELILYGKYISNTPDDKRFLVHEIRGMSLPKLPEFFFDRHNTSLVSDRPGEKPPKPGGWGPKPTKQENPEKKKPMNSKAPVGNNPGSVSGRASNLCIIGDKPKIHKAIRKEKQHTSNPHRKNEDHEEYSSSNIRRKHGVGSASMAIRHNLQSTSNSRDNSLLEAWAGLSSLINYGGVISIEALSINDMQPLFTPTLSFIQFPSVNSWAFSRGNFGAKRLLLVAKITYDRGICYVFEIEQKLSKAGKPYSRHSGAILNGEVSERELLSIIEQIPKLEGKWRDMPNNVLQKIRVFKHMKLGELGMRTFIANILSEHLSLTLLRK